MGRKGRWMERARAGNNSGQGGRGRGKKREKQGEVGQSQAMQQTRLNEGLNESMLPSKPRQTIIFHLSCSQWSWSIF